MKPAAFYICLIAAVIVNITGRVLATTPESYSIFFLGDALSFVLIMIAMRIAIKSTLVESVLLLTISNLFDELFFTPEKLQANEVIFAAMIAMWCAYKSWQKLKNNY